MYSIKKTKYLIILVLILTPKFGFSQDGRSLILIHNYTDKATIDPITNPTQGNIAFNQEDNSVYVFNGTKWIVDAYYKNITTTSAILPLEENNYTFIIEADILTTLPAAADHIGRECVLKNTLTTEVSVSNYNNNYNDIATTIPAENVLKVQSDGSIWHQVNNFENISSGTSCITNSGTLALSTSFNITNYDDEGPNREIYFEYTNGGTAPDITEVQVLIVDVPYSTFSILNATLNPTGTNVDLTVEPGVTLATSSGASCNTSTLYSHAITISGYTIQDGDVIEIDFDANMDGLDGGTGDITDCTGCILEFYTN